jgi:hypothetical protein
MAMMVTLQINKVLDTLLGTAVPTLFTGTQPKVSLTSTAPSQSATGTELTGTGYTAGGTVCDFNAAASGQATGPTSALSWTNGSGGSWSIVGLNIWDQAGTPIRWFFGSFTGQPISVANGNTFQIAAAGITVDASGY